MLRQLHSGWFLVILVLFLTACASNAAPTLVPTLAAPPQNSSAPAQPKPAVPTPHSTETLAASKAKPTETSPAPAANPPAAGEAFKGPLSVLIYNPQDNSEVQTAEVVINGEADPETVISINDQIAVAGPDRRFSVPITLVDGPNAIEITASDEAGNQGTAFLTVFYNAQP